MNTCRHLLASLLLPLCLGLGLAVPAPASAPPSPGKTQHLTSPDQVPDGLAQSDWTSIRAAYEAGRHAFQPVAEGFQARNPGQQWLTRFDRRGFIAQPNAGGWEWGLELKSYGFPGQERALTGVPALQAEGTRLTYNWDAAVQEWFVNDDRGLEHGFTVKERPPAAPVPNSQAALLKFHLAVRGTLTAQVAPDRQGVSFHDAAGAAALTYAGLKVWDADGRILSSRFEPIDSEHPSIVTLSVDERGARYPLTIDPIAQQAYLKASNAERNDEFGLAVAISGDTVVVGARLESGGASGVNGNQNDNSLSESGAAYVFVRNGTTWTQQAYLKASNPGAGDQFGVSVAVSGDTVVVGAAREASNATGVNGNQGDNSAPNSGAAYVFVRSGSTWTQQAYLKASNSEADDSFGFAVSVSGDTVAIGAVGEDSSATGVNGNQGNNTATSSGAAYVFVRSGSIWTQQAYLKASNPDALDFFGWSLGISGDIVVVGAYAEDSSATGVNGNQSDNSRPNSGAAYVFVRSGINWFHQAYLKASNTDANDLFGGFVAVSGTTVVVGATGEASNARSVNGNQGDNSAERSGAAYVFVLSGTNWIQQAYLKASNADPFDGFGQVAISGDTVVVGARGEQSNATGVNGNPTDNSAGSAGAAYVFVRNGTNWTQQAYLKASNTENGDEFGSPVAISGDTVVAGASLEASNAAGVNGNQSDNSAVDSGAAYIFTGLGPNCREIAVTSTNDSGPGSLRQALADVCTNATITFDPALNGQTILLTSGELVINGHLTILGPGPGQLAVSGNGASRIFHVASNATPFNVTIAGLTLSNAFQGTAEPGVPNAGAGILNEAGSLTLSNCLVTGCRSLNRGGGIANEGGTLMVLQSTLSLNSARFGGGIANTRGTLVMNNSTLHGNAAAQFSGSPVASGGGIYNFDPGTITVLNCTLAGNSAFVRGGALYNDSPNVVLNVRNSIVAGNSLHAQYGVGGADLWTSGSSLLSNGKNFIGNTNGIVNAGGLPDKTFANTLTTLGHLLATNSLGQPLLAANGGPTPTVALIPGSPALNAGLNSDAAALAYDQRGAGFPRLVGGTVDIGAYEAQGTNPGCSSSLTVTSLGDNGPGTLRAALSNLCPGGTITFDPALNGQTIVLTSGQLVIDKNLTILGPGASQLAISGNGSSRIFTINPGATSLLAGLTFTNGNAPGFSSRGGGLFNGGSLIVSNSAFRGNVTEGTGGGISSSGTLAVLSCTFSGNQARDIGGGIEQLLGTALIKDCVLNGNSAGGGGGIENWAGALLTVQNTTFSGNRATNGSGGGIENYSARVTIQGCTLGSNSASRYGGAIESGYGSGLTTLAIQNSTLSGNSAQLGGGIQNEFGSILSALNTTITGNRVMYYGGGIYPASVENLTNCIVAGNVDTDGVPNDIDCDPEGQEPGTYVCVIESASGNLIGDAGTAGTITNGVNGNLVGNAGSGTRAITSILNPNLASNGGPTLTHALVAGSPAINAGNSSASGGLSSDQRGPGFPRLAGGSVDIGAFEFQNDLPPAIACPPNILRSLGQGSSTVVVTWTVDWNGGGGASCTPPSGSAFGVGTTPVTCVASNAAGSDTCAFTVTVVATTPVLTITRGAPGQVTLSWTPAPPGFVLQESSSLTPASWSNSPSGAANPVTVPAAQQRKFYRVIQP